MEEKDKSDVDRYWDEFYAEATKEQIEEVERQFRMVPEKASMDLPHELDYYF